MSRRRSSFAIKIVAAVVLSTAALGAGCNRQEPVTAAGGSAAAGKSQAQSAPGLAPVAGAAPAEFGTKTR